VFIEPQAAYLEDQVLDAQIDAQGKARFSLGMQGPGQVWRQGTRQAEHRRARCAAGEALPRQASGAARSARTDC
jgi:hypothetical protein